MTLTLSVLRCPDAVAPETRRVGGGEFAMGRGSDNDWPLADPDRILSKRHCVLEYRSGGWQVRDLSTNGTYVNRDAEPIGQGRVRDLRDGDRLRLGAYEMEVRIEESADWQMPAGRAAPAPATPARSSFDDDSLFSPASPFGTPDARPGREPLETGSGISLGSQGLDAGSLGGGGSGGPLLPDDFDFGFDAGGRSAPTQPDHAPPHEQVFVPPRPAATLLPDDDDDWLSPLPPAAAPPPPVASPASPPPMSRSPATRLPTLPDASPFAEPGDEAAASPAAISRPATQAVPPAGGEGDLMAAFLRGAGLEDARPADPLAAMTALGEAFRALVSGLRQALIARATIKGEFRIEQTMLRARGNNPLKFSAGDDDALAALIGAGRRTDMTAAAAVADSLRDIRLHELATMAAMQSAVRALLTRLDPAPLRAEADRAGGLLPAQRRARAFEAYEKLHADIARALADDFDSVFGRAFARAYEQALAEAGDREG